MKMLPKMLVIAVFVVIISSSTTIALDVPGPGYNISCYFCDPLTSEPAAFCRLIVESEQCQHPTDVCYWTVSTGPLYYIESKGCMDVNTCNSQNAQNTEWCDYGTVTSSCTWCCSDIDNCNVDKLDYSDTSPASTTTSTQAMTTSMMTSCEWDVTAYTSCLMEFQSLIVWAAKDTDLNFNEFCRRVPEVYRCLADAVNGCCSSDVGVFNETLEAILTNLTSECPLSCNPPAGYNCSYDYYTAVIIAIINGGKCVDIEKIQSEQARCRLKTTASCDGTVRTALNASFWELDSQVVEFCSSTVQDTPPYQGTESPNCVVSDVQQCTLQLGVAIIDYYNFATDLGELCALFEAKLSCYTEISVTCSEGVRLELEAAWNFTANMIAGTCATAALPVCDPHKARSCILDLYNLIYEAKDFQAACNLIPMTWNCVVVNLAACDPSDQIATNNSLQRIIDVIGDRCNQVATIYGNSTLEITEGGHSEYIQYVLLVSPSTLCGSDNDCMIFIEIDIEVGKKTPKCSNGTSISQAVIGDALNPQSPASLCSREITDTNYNILQNISVVAKLDFKFDGTQYRNMTIWMRKTVAGVTTQLRSLANFSLIIHDMDKQGAMCHSVNDPHITTFDGFFYNNFQEGFFVLYRHAYLPSEVHIVTQRCNEHDAACNCAVAVRSGDTIFFVNSCRKKTIPFCKFFGNEKYKCKNLMKVSLSAHTHITEGTIIRSKNNGKDFLIVHSYGTTIRISIGGDYINIWITPSPLDWKNTQGLCGYYDGDQSNDLRQRDAYIYRKSDCGWGKLPIGFNDNWRVSDVEMIYNGVPARPYVPPWYCECRNGTSRCGYDILYETCDFDLSGDVIDINFGYTNPPKKEKDKERHRRQADTTLADFDIDTSYIPPNISSNGIYNESAANATCQEYFNSVAVASMCTQSVAPVGTSFDACVQDLMVTGDTIWMTSALEALKQQCMQELTMNPVYYQSTLANSIISTTCPNQCSNQGTCTNGTCTCNRGYTGDDCSFNASATITDVALYTSLCDFNNTALCNAAQLLGFGFIPSITNCTVQQVNIDGSTVVKSGPILSLGNALFVGPTEVHCLLNITNSGIPISYYIMVNNQPLLSVLANPMLFIAFNSVCYKCTTFPAPSCVPTDTSCVIGGTCYGPGEQSPSDPCQVCAPMTSQTTWSHSDSTECQTFSLVGLIIGVVLGGALLIVIITIISIICIKRQYTKSENLARNARTSTTSVHRRSTEFDDVFYGEYMYPPPGYDDIPVKYDNTGMVYTVPPTPNPDQPIVVDSGSLYAYLSTAGGSPVTIMAPAKSGKDAGTLKSRSSSSSSK